MNHHNNLTLDRLQGPPLAHIKTLVSAGRSGFYGSD